MTRIISVAGQKGGIGKTTTAVNLASCIAMKASPVLLLDLDPQGSTMDWVAMMEKKGQRLFEYQKALPESLTQIININRDYFKYIIIDCPPRLEKIMEKIINISHLIVTPVGLGAIESWAFDDFNEAVKSHQLNNNGMPRQAVFMNDVDIRRSRLINQTAGAIAKEGFDSLCTIHSRNSVVEAPGLGKCTIHMNNELATREIETLTTQLMGILDEI